MSSENSRGPGRPGPTDHPVTGTLRRADLAERLHERGFAHRDARALVSTVLSEVTDALVRGESVKLAGFGTFSVVRRKRRTARDLQSGEDMAIGERDTVTFRPARSLREHLTRALTPPGQEEGES